MDPLLLAPAVHSDQQDYIGPSSPHSNLYDISPHLGSAYDSFDIHPDSVSHFPHTPSYNGSYQNSPYSTYSDLPPIDGADDIGLFQDNPSGISITEEYDPSDYDVPSAGNPLTFDDHFTNTNVSVSVTPPLNDYSSPNAFDHASPASSNGLEDDNHSHASSNSSYMHPSSPRPDISQTFQDLSFRSPAWPQGSLPDDRRSPPLSKPQSPPQLLIPDTTSPGGADGHSPPTINAPDGDGGLMGGPTLQIVPATPISGGGVTAQNVPFQDTLANLQSGEFPPCFALVSASLSADNAQARPRMGAQMGRSGRGISIARRMVSTPIKRSHSLPDQARPRRSTTAPSNHRHTSITRAGSNNFCFPRLRNAREACPTLPCALRRCGTRYR
ncbi:hypothetical protein BD311DRAFT_433253 [Dichomitus squalens]|uniref:Uncharacterized protein n=1 Tax=Dichomitus squalens TaxID=114155 RepID=A0A4V2K1M0_9APHY|nr:hypothetical protein BD311DRAFT_433253 [Dichomitus squalens]